MIEFRALQPDGLLLYMADFSVSADNYMALFMHDGHLVFSCITDSGVSQTTDVTRLLTTEFRYDDAQWYQVSRLPFDVFNTLILSHFQYDHIRCYGLVCYFALVLIGPYGGHFGLLQITECPQQTVDLTSTTQTLSTTCCKWTKKNSEFW